MAVEGSKALKDVIPDNDLQMNVCKKKKVEGRIANSSMLNICQTQSYSIPWSFRILGNLLRELTGR